MDRDELQDRIRARRSGADPYRRGGALEDDGPAYERFEPEPEDTHARRRRDEQRRRDELSEAAEPGGRRAPPPAASVPPPPAERPDVTREHDDWADRAPAPMPTPPPAVAPPPAPAAAPTVEAEHVDNYDDDAYDAGAYPYEYDDWDDDRDRRSSGAGAFAILGFLGLGVLALLGGAVLAGVFSGDPNTGSLNPTLTPSPTVVESVAPSVEPSADPSVDPSVDPSGEPPASGEPVVFPDGFTAEAQPCIPGSAGGEGCDSNAVSNNGNVWVWVGFSNGTENDVIGAEIVGPDGTTVGEGSIDLARIGCRPRCPGGWTYFPFSGLGPGTYDVEITRNGDPAGSTSFEVS